MIYVALISLPKSIVLYSRFDGVNGSCIIAHRFSSTACDTASFCLVLDICGIVILVFFGYARVLGVFDCIGDTSVLNNALSDRLIL